MQGCFPRRLLITVHRSVNWSVPASVVWGNVFAFPQQGQHQVKCVDCRPISPTKLELEDYKDVEKKTAKWTELAQKFGVTVSR